MKKRINIILSAVLAVIAPLIPISLVSASTFPGINGRILYTNTNSYAYYQPISVKPDGTGATTFGSSTSSWRYANYSSDGTKVLFTAVVGSYNHIFKANVDATGVTQLTSGNTNNIQASFSPDGTKIVYASANGSFYQLWTMDADGGNKTQLVSVADNCYYASYSPDGTKIAFQTSFGGGGGFEIYKVNADGTSMANLTNNAQHDTSPRWSPDGTKIVYDGLPSGDYEIYIMNADGSNKTALTSDSIGQYNPVFSPDGTKIAYRAVPVDPKPELFVMNIDGSNQTQLTTNGWVDAGIDWQPLTIQPASGTPNPTVTVNGNTATINIPSLYTDTYSGINNASVSVTTSPAKGTTSVDPATGVITYTQTATAHKKSFWNNVALVFFPKAYAATTDSFGYQVCSQASSSLCSTGTITVVLGTSTELAATGNNHPLIPIFSIILIVSGIVTLSQRKKQNQS